MLFCGEAILALLFHRVGIQRSNRGQDAHDTQGRDALATWKTIAKLRLTLPPIAERVARGLRPPHQAP